MAKTQRAERDIELWRTWKDDKNQQTLKPLLKAIEPIIVQQTTRMTGNLPRSAIKAQATKLAIEYMDHYDPEKSQLNTFLINNMGRKLNRYVYEHQNIGTIPEPRIIQIGTYNKIKTNLEEQLNRKPTIEELADELAWPVRQVELLQKELRQDLVHDFSFGTATDDQRTDIDENIEMLRAELIGQEKDVLEYTYGLGGKSQLSNTEMAGKLGISPSMVTQIKTRLGERLRSSGVMTGY